MATKKKEPGKGRKACPQCGEVVGARTLVCKCGHEFETKSQAKPPASGLAAALAALKDLKGLIKDEGGLDAAIERVNQIEEVVTLAGGFPELRAALKTADEI